MSLRNLMIIILILFSHISYAEWNRETLATLPYSLLSAEVSNEELYVGTYHSNELKTFQYKNNQWLPIEESSINWDTMDISYNDIRAMKIDKTGAYHFVYETDNVWYATNKSGVWVKETVALDTAGHGMTMEIDEKGFAHLASLVFAKRGRKIAYATNASGEWKVSDVFQIRSGNHSYEGKLSIDEKGNAHLSSVAVRVIYIPCGYGSCEIFKNVTVSHYTNLSGKWKKVKLPRKIKKSDTIKISVDKQGFLHAIFVKASKLKNKVTLTYATNTGNQWQYQQIAQIDSQFFDHITLLGVIPNLDSSNKVHISYGDRSLIARQIFHYVTIDGDSVNNEIISEDTFAETGVKSVASAAKSTDDVVLLIDSNAKPHLIAVDQDQHPTRSLYHYTK